MQKFRSWLQIYIFFSLILTVYGLFYFGKLSDELYTLDLSHNGPVTLDIPITFTAELVNSTNSSKFIYQFEDNAHPPHKFEANGSSSISTSIVYPESIYQPGEYTMNVQCMVVVLDEIFIKIASAQVNFLITEYIPAKLNIEEVKKRYDRLYASSGDKVNISINVELPEEILEETEMTYSWNINKKHFITTTPFYSHHFRKSGSYSIHVSIVARIMLPADSFSKRRTKYKWGYLDAELEVKDSFHAINLTGNTYLQHGELFRLDVACNGSGPFEYCWKIVHPSENLTDFSCISPVVTTMCAFPIVYYFNPSGDYRVVILIDNYVSSMQRKVDVHIFDVSLKPQLSTVVIPLFCSVVVIFIIVVGVVLHVRRNQHLDIETADFDFLQSSDTCVVETFWERLYHSIIRTFYIRNTIPHLYLRNAADPSDQDAGSTP